MNNIWRGPCTIKGCMVKEMKSIRDANVKDKKVLLRVDFNVPIKDGKITDINRIRTAVPTIQYLIDNDAKIIIITHVGRPEGKVNAEFSTIPMASELAKLLHKEISATDHVIKDDYISKKIEAMEPKDILVLGNLRFHPEEEANDETFAKKIASYADIYVNDAFAVSHRSNASVDAITKYIPSYSGLLLESEITSLGFLLQTPTHPFCLIIGGAKVMDKAGVITKLADKADKILIGGAVANTFLLAKGENVSESLVEPEMVGKCKEMLEKFEDKIILPEDFVKEELDGGKFKIMDIGSSTIDRFKSEIINSNAVFWNGNIGYTEDEKYAQGTKLVAETIASHDIAIKVAAGGDTVGFLDEHNLQKSFSFVSTGGGAALEFLAGEKLPGIEALERSSV